MEINDKNYELSEKTPLELASNVHGLLAVKKDGSAGAVGLEEIANEAGKKVGDAVKIVGNVLPTLGNVNKRYSVTVGANGLTLTYLGQPFVLTPNCQVDMFWDGLPKTWLIDKQTPLPTVDTSTLVSKSDIKSTSVNLFDKNTMLLPNTIINSDGNLQGVTGGVTARIDISGLKEPDKDLLISWRGKLGANGPYYAFYEGATMKSYAAYNNNLSKTVTAPPTSNVLYITVKSAADASSDVYANFMVNVGATALAYKPYEGFITQIDGKKVAASGGVEADQTLNKADSVAFKEVTTDLVKTESLVTDEIKINGTIRKGTLLNPPPNLMPEEFWHDITDSADSPIVRQKL